MFALSLWPAFIFLDPFFVSLSLGLGRTGLRSPQLSIRYLCIALLVIVVQFLYLPPLFGVATCFSTPLPSVLGFLSCSNSWFSVRIDSQLNI